MVSFVCTQCGLEYMGPVDIPSAELKCRICGNQRFSCELEEDYWEKKKAKEMRINNRINKIIATLLIFVSIYTALNCYAGFTSFGNSFFSPAEYQYNPQTDFVSWLILIIHFLQMLTFFGLFYYGFSVIINTKLDYVSEKWLYLGVFAVCLYIVEYIAWSMPLRPVEGFTQTTSFIGRFFSALFSTNNLYYNLFQLLAYATFFGLFSKLKSGEAVDSPAQ